MKPKKKQARYATFQRNLGLWHSCLIYHNPWRRRTLRRFYAQFIRPGDLCFDIGAHVGNRIGTWLGLGATVIGVEPQPHCLAFLKRWYGQHTRVTLVDQAVGAQPGHMTLYMSTRHPTVTTLSSSWIAQMEDNPSFEQVSWDQECPVAVTTLDALIAQYGRPDFCKIDVEGFEQAVLTGLSQALPFLSFEYNPAALAEATGCIALLEKLGNYRYNWSVGESHIWGTDTWLSADQLIARLPLITTSGKSGDIYAQLSLDNLSKAAG